MATATAGSADHTEDAAGPAIPVARYDEFFDPRKRTTVYRKTNKADLTKHFQKLNKKKPILVVRRRIDSKGRLYSTEVDIRSRKLCNLLQKIYEVTQRLWSVQCNQKLFYHAYPELEASLKKERASRKPDEELVHDLEVAIAFIFEDHADTFSNTEALLSGEWPSITFDLLWTLFCPGSLLYSYDEYTDQGRILKAQTYEIMKDMETGQWYAFIRSHMVAHDGRTFGLAIVTHKIYEFDGTRKLQDLGVYPLKYHPKEVELRSKAITRGHKFVNMLDHAFFEATGPAVYEKFNPDWELELRRFSAYGRVMIDPASYRVWQPSVKSLINPSVLYRLDPTRLTDEQYMLCTPIVLGFSFTAKQWGGFALDRITDVDWTSKPFESLVLNPKLKDLVHSMVKQHRKGTSEFDDVVKGKGKGLVGLLCGPPGCGKTLTAEAVAEATQCPLYCLSAGELGTKLEDVEDKLTQVLELAHKWKAVVLLDEADVFLAQRDSTDVQRNALVSIFLRKLEYYQGILILTTNLITHCDIAFESRIHFTIHYPPLSMESRRQIWETFISQIPGKPTVTQSDIDELAKVSLNGRQIKNSVSVAQSFASGARQQLSIDHIYTVLEVMRDWQKAKQASINELPLPPLNPKPETETPDNRELSTEKSDASSTSDTNSKSLNLTNGLAGPNVTLQPNQLDVRLVAALTFFAGLASAFLMVLTLKSV
ncbi:hypothetical protein EST38_g11108 [Candolleomyces aberdarensis]|uniref:AAA+ ATPase domain-containing protein n=1 Tax=Candolleomyces aberdarensis TaxID=2316362 RepID=A0A4Q2D814_9AGAR|nr:hypothetical protein EST38_g11108 [Candolleomyces aberdarensis]